MFFRPNYLPGLITSALSILTWIDIIQESYSEALEGSEQARALATASELAGRLFALAPLADREEQWTQQLRNQRLTAVAP